MASVSGTCVIGLNDELRHLDVVDWQKCLEVCALVELVCSVSRTESAILNRLLFTSDVIVM